MPAGAPNGRQRCKACRWRTARRKQRGSAAAALGCCAGRGAAGASATALQPPPHLLTTLPAPAGGGRRVRHGVRTSLDVLGMTENQALRIENGYHLAPAYLLAITRSCRSAGGPWTNPELQRPPRRRRMASTRPPGTYSPSARTGRRGGGSGSVDGMVRRAGSDALSMSLRSTAPVGSSAASIRRRNRPNTAFRFRGCFDMRNPLQHNPGPRGPGRTDGDRGRRGRTPAPRHPLTTGGGDSRLVGGAASETADRRADDGHRGDPGRPGALPGRAGLVRRSADSGRGWRTLLPRDALARTAEARSGVCLVTPDRSRRPARLREAIPRSHREGYRVPPPRKVETVAPVRRARRRGGGAPWRNARRVFGEREASARRRGGRGRALEPPPAPARGMAERIGSRA